ncbi:hypothetical protein ABFX02_05G055100 [Erythranthe guttata]
MAFYYGGVGYGRTGCVVFGLPSVSTNESLRCAFSPFGKLVRAIIAINPPTNQYFGYVVFEDEPSAREAVKRMNGKKIDGHQITVKEYRFPEFPPTDPLSPEVYARLGRLGCVVFGLPSGTTNESLRRAFSPFGKLVRAIIAINPPTNQYLGTVVFEDEPSAREAVKRMNGKKIDGHQIIVKEYRFPEFPVGSNPGLDYQKASASASDSASDDMGPLGCVVDGLGSGATDESFTRAFSQFGDVIHAKIARDAGCGKKIGMVVYEDERSAREAVERMNGKEIDGYRITVKESRYPQFRRRAVAE